MKRILQISFICALCMVMALFAIAAAPSSGSTFLAEDCFLTEELPNETPYTFEAWVKIEKGAGRVGAIYSNYGLSASEYSLISFEIAASGNPGVYWKPIGVDAKSLTFYDIDIRNDEWTHVAIVITSSNAKCYINGFLKETIETEIASIDVSTLAPMKLGGDYRKGNTIYFKKGELGPVCVYADSHSYAQIQADYRYGRYNSPDLLGAYDFSAIGNERLKDLSKHGNHVVYTNTTTGDSEKYIAVEEGLRFDNANGEFLVENDLPVAPHTFEVEFYFPDDYNDAEEGGIIIGNYQQYSAKEWGCVFLQVFTNGNLRYYWRDADDNPYAVYFDIDAYRGEWIHVAITHDYDTGVFCCYVNGEFLNTTTKLTPHPAKTTKNYYIGGDGREENLKYFRGNLRSVAVYSDIRTAEEIAADVKTPGTDDLILYYDFSEYKYNDRPEVVKDLSEYGNDLVYKSYFVDKTTEVSDYDYSIAVIGDTQNLVDYYPDYVGTLYDWVIENKDDKNIKAVLGVGDITNRSIGREWTVVLENFEKLDGVLPYTLVRGNHDTRESFDSVLVGTTYDAQISENGGRFSEDSLLNTYLEFSAGETDYLVINIDYEAEADKIEWMCKVVEAHPNHKVIITTHAFVSRHEKISSDWGEEVWDSFIKKYENIVLVLSGHETYNDTVVFKKNGIHGNTVTMMMINPQVLDKNSGPVGAVCMLYFTESGISVEVESYSTVKEKYVIASNQFTMAYNEVVGDVDYDYKVDFKDAMLALKAAVNKTDLHKADMNGDGSVGLIDFIRIMKIIVK